MKWQDPKTGVWWQVTNQGDRKGNYLEASASAMFVYTLAKGVNTATCRAKNICRPSSRATPV